MPFPGELSPVVSPGKGHRGVRDRWLCGLIHKTSALGGAEIETIYLELETQEAVCLEISPLSVLGENAQ